MNYYTPVPLIPNWPRCHVSLELHLTWCPGQPGAVTLSPVSSYHLLTTPSVAFTAIHGCEC